MLLYCMRTPYLPKNYAVLAHSTHAHVGPVALARRLHPSLGTILCLHASLTRVEYTGAIPEPTPPSLAPVKGSQQ